jgi:DNA-binding NarL/FixJ family response regulator
VKILLIEDDQIVRECVESLVGKSDGALQLFVAISIEQGLDLAADNSDIGLALLGLGRGGEDVAKFAKKFHAEHEHIPLVVLAATEQERLVLETLDAGAMGFINKGVSTRSLLRALRTVLNGGIHVPMSVLQARGLYNPPRDSARSAIAARLLAETAGDQQGAIARLMLRGTSNWATAKNLGIPEALVREEVSSLLKILAVTSRAEAVLVFAAAPEAPDKA